MARVLPLHTRGDVFVDTRGQGRALRVTWHHEDGIVVLSLWREDICTGTFRLVQEDVAELVNVLVGGLGQDGHDRLAGRQVG